MVHGALYSGLSGSSWSRNQRRCCANDSGKGWVRSVRGIGLISSVRPALIFSIRGASPSIVGVSNRKRKRYFYARPFANARDDLCGQQRVAAQFEEVVVDADLLDTQNIGPNRGQVLFRQRAGLDKMRRLVAAKSRWRQGAPINFSVRGYGYGIQFHETRTEPYSPAVAPSSRSGSGLRHRRLPGRASAPA